VGTAASSSLAASEPSDWVLFACEDFFVAGGMLLRGGVLPKL